MWGNALTDSCGTATMTALTSLARCVHHIADPTHHTDHPPLRPAGMSKMWAMAPHAKVGDQPVNVRLPRELHEAVLTRAEKEDRTMAQTIRVALRYYLEQTKPIVGA